MVARSSAEPEYRAMAHMTCYFGLDPSFKRCICFKEAYKLLSVGRCVYPATRENSRRICLKLGILKPTLRSVNSSRRFEPGPGQPISDFT